MGLAGRGEAFRVGQRVLQAVAQGGRGLGQGLEVGRAPAGDLGDVAVRQSLLGRLGQLAGFEAELLLDRGLLREGLAQGTRVGLAAFQFGRA